MEIRALSFDPGQRIPDQHTEDGKDLSPALHWSAVPAGTVSLALICEDPDAPTPEPWIHWLIWNIPPQAQTLQEGVPRLEELPQPRGARQGRNSWPDDNLGWRGPAPPRGHGTHHYHFRVYALDTMLDVPPGADVKALRRAMRGHVLEEAEVVGTYSR